MRIYKIGAAALIGLAASILTASAGDYASALQINQNSSDFMGKTIAFTGKVDRVISPGTFLVNDSTSESGPNHRILVVTNTSGVSDQFAKQQAGTVGTNLNDGDLVQFNGKVQKLTVQSEVQTYSPGSDYSIKTTSESMPVLVVKPGDVQKIS